VRAVAGQAAAVVVALTAYAVVRGSSSADPAPALAHAHDLVRLERRLGLFREPALQALVADHDPLVDTLNTVYVWGHLPLIAAVLTWLAVRHPQEFRLTRNAVFVSCALALVVYTLYPVAPPRLAGLGLFDSVEARSHAYRVLQPPSFVNQYAAMPSMHMGWDVLMALAIVRRAGSLLARRAALLLPPLMLAAIVLTANHYLLDAVAGTAVALVGLAVAHAWRRWRAEHVPCPQVALPRPRTAP
jgi:hypothetical protein